MGMFNTIDKTNDIYRPDGFYIGEGATTEGLDGYPVPNIRPSKCYWCLKGHNQHKQRGLIYHIVACKKRNIKLFCNAQKMEKCDLCKEKYDEKTHKKEDGMVIKPGEGIEFGLCSSCSNLVNYTVGNSPKKILNYLKFMEKEIDKIKDPVQEENKKREKVYINGMNAMSNVLDVLIKDKDKDKDKKN